MLQSNSITYAFFLLHKLKLPPMGQNNWNSTTILFVFGFLFRFPQNAEMYEVLEKNSVMQI